MKKTLLSSLLFLFYSLVFAQSTDLDKEYFKVSYIGLPSEPILDNNQRTYSANNNAIRISGFSKVSNSGSLELNYSYNGTSTGEVNINKKEDKKKDKEGNVTSVKVTYTINSSYSSAGVLSVTNVVTGNTYTKSYSENSDYTSAKFNSYKAAQNYYNNNRSSLRSKYANQHKSRLINSANGHLLYVYGYNIKSNFKAPLKILDSKKHPEFAEHQKAFENIKTAFSKMKYNQPITFKEELLPVIEYFDSVIPKYEGSKRKNRKIRYASYYNIAQIFYYLDEPEKVKEYAEKIIENDFNKSDGENLIKSADRLLKRFEDNETTTRHFEVITEDLTNEPVEEEEENPLIDIEVNQAYLITKANDTTLVDIKTSDMKAIAYTLKTVKYDDNGTPFGTQIHQAKATKELLFLDGNHYRNIKFKESSIKGGAVDAGQAVFGGASEKICKVIYESDIISLYLFNDKEPVIFPAGSEKGKSTLSSGYVFGFKKNLSKLAEGCPELQEKVTNKVFSNNAEDLTSFCKELSRCNTN